MKALRHPFRSLSEAVGGPVYPLLILFGLNAVDELDRTAFGILVPEIRDAFGLDLTGLLGLVAVVGVAALGLQVPIAQWADRTKRVRLALGGAVVWACFSFATGLAWTVWALAIFRSGSAVGKAVVDPTHNSLISDYYEPGSRARAYAVHRTANSVGQFVGPLAGGLLAFSFGWRTPFFVFAVPTILLVVLGWRLREPIRGAHERRAMGASEEAVGTEEEAPSFAEGWRTVWKIRSLRRIWYSLPFLAVSLVGFVVLASLFYEEVFGLDERARGFVAAGVEPLQIVGLVIGARVGTRLLARDPGLALRFLGGVSFVASALAAGFALAPSLWLAIAANAMISLTLAVLVPGILASLSLAIPPRSRSLGFSVGSLWVIPGLAVLPVIGSIGDAWGIRTGMLVMTPIFVLGGLVIASAGRLVAGDVQQVWTTAAARSEALLERRRGRSKLLLVRGLDASYGDVQVLHDIDFEVDEGEIVALLGTNGAGKSTFLKSITGVVEADRGAVIFDGREMTYTPPNEVASRGVVLVPGGAGVFPSLTVAENLQTADWLRRGEAGGVERIYELFGVLGERRGQAAASLSGGEQQMLALGMALLTKPRLLAIDELSLGLAPIVVEQLLSVLRELNEEGTTIVLVEQSVNLALTLAGRAYFMERGRIRFEGPTAELLERPDVLRSVFLARDDAPLEIGSPDGDGREVSDAGAEPVLETIGLTCRYGGITAVDEVSLRVAPGEIVGVIGPNGAGKTTLFDAVTGFVSTDAGRILLGGTDVTGSSVHARARRGLGRSFQDARLFGALTVEEAIAVALERSIGSRSALAAAMRLPSVYDAEEKVRARTAELVESLGLEAYREKFLAELSTGTRRIVDLACAIAHEPSVLLLDEPSSGIAQREVEALAPLLERIRGLGVSLVVVEHDIPLISSVADRLVAMDQGRVIATGPPEAVLRDGGVIASYLGSDGDAIARSGRRERG